MRLWITLCFILFLSVLCPAKLRADLNADGRVDILDLAILSQEWLLSEAEVYSMALGPEILTDIGLDNSEIWHPDNVIINGVATFGEGGGIFWQATPSVIYNHTYRISIEVITPLANPETGEVFVELSGQEGWVNIGVEAKVWEIDIIAGASFEQFRVSGDDFSAGVVVDNVSVKEILEDTGGIAMDVFDMMDE